MSQGGGGGGRRWVDKYVHAYVDIAGPMLGIQRPSRAYSAVKCETAILGELEGMLGGLLETAVGRLIGSQIKEVCETFRTWGALWAMLPRRVRPFGGTNLGAPEIIADDVINFFLQMRDAGSSVEQSVNHTVNSALDMLFECWRSPILTTSRVQSSRQSRFWQRLKKLVRTWNERRHRVS